MLLVFSMLTISIAFFLLIKSCNDFIEVLLYNRPGYKFLAELEYFPDLFAYLENI